MGRTGSPNTPEARISPDGRLVAYDWYIHKENAVELRIASLAGAEPVRPKTIFRAEVTAGAYMSAWMPDGKQLLVLRQHPGRTWQIGSVTIEDGSFQGIKSLEWRRPNVLSPSPDGRFIAYDVPEGESGSPLDIFVLATDGSQEAVLRNPANDSFPLWSPDGSRLVFLSDRTGSNALWTGTNQGRAAERSGIADQEQRRLDDSACRHEKRNVLLPLEHRRPQESLRHGSR